MKTSMSRSTFKILFYVKKGSERANGYLPLMCRLTVDGEIKQFSCKLDVPPKLWDVKTARATGKSAEARMRVERGTAWERSVPRRISTVSSLV